MRRIEAIDLVASDNPYQQANRDVPPPNAYSYKATGAPPPQLNPLMKQANTASVGILFALLIWRSLAAYELAERFESSMMRLVTVIPAIAILCSNVLGFVVNFMKPMNFKNYLKLILALNIVREWTEMAYNVVALVTGLGNAREVSMGRLFMNMWWSFLCISFSKSRWVLNVILPHNHPARNAYSA